MEKKGTVVIQLLSGQHSWMLLSLQKEEDGTAMYVLNIKRKDKKKQVRLKTFSFSVSKITKARNGIKNAGEQLLW